MFLIYWFFDDFFRISKNPVFGYSWSTWKPRFPMDKRPLVEGHIANFGISLDIFQFLRLEWFFLFFKKIWFWVFLVHPETTLPDGLETFGRRAYRYFCHISRRFWVFAFLVIFSIFQKKMGFGVFLVHPPMASVLLSASVGGALSPVSRIFFWLFLAPICVSYMGTALELSTHLEKEERAADENNDLPTFPVR